MIFFTCCVLTFTLSFFHVFFHELGHAIPAFMLTKQKVEVYIGSYGDKNDCIIIKTKPFDFWIKYNPLYWFKGMCRPTAENTTLNIQIIYIALGPVVSIVYISLIFYLLPYFDPDGNLSIFPLLLALAAITVLAANIWPIKKSPKTDNEITYNDGYSLLLLLKTKRLEKGYIKAFANLEKNNTADAANFFEKATKKDVINVSVFRYALQAFINEKRYDVAKRLINSVSFADEFTSNDLTQIAYVKMQFHQNDEAIQILEKALLLDDNNIYALNNIGYLYTVFNRFSDAFAPLNRAIELNAYAAYAYNNRGYAKIGIGDMEGGYADIKKSLELEDNNSYVYRNMGIYYMKSGNYEEAYSWFKKAQSLDANTPMLEELLKETSDKLIDNALL